MEHPLYKRFFDKYATFLPLVKVLAGEILLTASQICRESGDVAAAASVAPSAEDSFANDFDGDD